MKTGVGTNECRLNELAAMKRRKTFDVEITWENDTQDIIQFWGGRIELTLVTVFHQLLEVQAPIDRSPVEDTLIT